MVIEIRQDYLWCLEPGVFAMGVQLVCCNSYVLRMSWIGAFIAGRWWEWGYAENPLITNGCRYDAYTAPQEVWPE